MGVYINMGMPKDGVYWCEIGVAGDIATITIHGEERKSFPLVPVPEPHGRLIDADAIPYKKIMYDDDDFYYGVTKPYIDRIPTVIPASEEVSA